MINQELATGLRTKLVLLLLLGAIALATPILVSTSVEAAGQYGPEGDCASTASHRTIQEGNSGKSVRHAQCLLNQRGYNLDVDGIFGPKTDQAVRDFQGNQGLEADGIIGEDTWYALHQNRFPDKPPAQ
jgi:peptidoglycan hydrolase-like protein with peptidoglycan-binding domain